MAALFWGDNQYVRVVSYGRSKHRGKGNEGVIFGVNDQRGDANTIDDAYRASAVIIIIGAVKAMRP